jgi:hypothetical protein
LSLDEDAARRERDKDVIDDLEITVGETEIMLGDAELGDNQLTAGWDEPPEASEHERVTVAPPMPEAEYVATMMKELPEAERVPLSRAITPPRGLSKPPMSTASAQPSPRKSKPPESAESAPPSRASRRPSTRPKKKERDSKIPRARTSRAPVTAPSPQPSEPLTLDLSDSLLPIPVASPVPVPHFDRAVVPKFDAVESAPPLPPFASRPRPTLPSTNQTSALDAVSNATPFQSSDPPRFSFGPAAGDALELVGVHAQSVKPGLEPKATMTEVRDRFEVGDFSGALTLAAKILEEEPEHVDALLYAEHCRDVLKQMYISNLGGLRRVPQIAVSSEQLRWLALDHRAGFLLSQLDGHSTFEELLDVCGMPPFEAIRLLVQLLQQNVIRVV